MKTDTAPTEYSLNLSPRRTVKCTGSQVVRRNLKTPNHRDLRRIEMATSTLPPPFAGTRFGRLTTTGNVSIGGGQHRMRVECVCDCGKTVVVVLHSLRYNKTKSCGCLKLYKEEALHQSNTPLNWIWRAMRQRCFNRSNPSYKNYGGRGITVCAEWCKSFRAFSEWANANGYLVGPGRAGRGLTLERKDNNGDYEPSNCYWATMDIQANNTRRNVVLTAFGETRTVAQWARDPRTQVTYKTLSMRIHSWRWTPEDALTTPPADMGPGRGRSRKEIK